ncbi:MAG: hypothetical protein ACXWTU_05875, partial [Methylotenera sp.]
MFRSIWAHHKRRRFRFSVNKIMLTLTLLGTFAFNSVASAEDEPLFLAVNINGVELGDVVTVLKIGGGDLVISEEDVLTWRLNSANCERLWLEGKPYIRLEDLAGVNYYIDTGTQTLLLLAPATAFIKTKLDCGTESALGLSPTQAGGFFNYDLSWQHTNN